MFGMSFSEMIVILIIAVIALGPEKLPKAMVEIAKYLKILKKTVNDAKSSFEQEIKIAELKEDAKKYKESITQTTQSVRKKLTFEELDEIKNGINSAKDSINESFNDIKNDLQNDINSIKNLSQKDEKEENLQNKEDK